MRLALVATGLLWLAFAGNAWGARAWLPPVTVTPPATVGGDQQLAITPDGTLIAVWVQQMRDWTVDPEYGSRTMALVKRPSDLVPEPVQLEGPAGGHVALAVNDRGDAAVAWHDLSEYPSHLEVARLKAGDAAFGAPERLGGPDQITSNQIEIAINRRGDVAVVDRDWRAHELDHAVLGWIGLAGQPFEPGRLLGAKTSYGLARGTDVAIAPDGTATALIEDSPHLNPDVGETGPARISAVTWRAGGGTAREEWVQTAPEGRSLGCARIGIDRHGRAAAQWNEGQPDCHAPDHMESGPLQVAWRDAGEEEFGQPLDGAGWVTRTQRGTTMSAGGEVLAAYHPYTASSYDPLGVIGRPDGRVALAQPFAPPLETQAVAGEPRDAMLAPNGRGLLVLAERPHTDTYFARLTVSRREPGGLFGPLEDVRADCLPASIWTRGAIGDGGEAAILSQNQATGGLDLYLDTEVPQELPRTCALPPVELPPIDPTVPAPELPLPPLPLPAAEGSVPGVQIGTARVRRRGRVRILTVPVRCAAACAVRGNGRFLAGRRVLSRDRGTASAGGARVARLRLRFRAARRPLRRAKVAAQLAVRPQQGPPSAYRLIAPAR